MPLERSDAVRRAKTPLGRRAMRQRKPKIIEEPKWTIVLKGHATSQTVVDLLGDLHLLKKPLSRKMQRKNDILPFEVGGDTHLENLARLNDASLFALGNHTKKRPHNLILGRMFGFRILDMIEFGVLNYRSIASFSRKIPSAPGSMPCLLFNGEDYHATETTEKLHSILYDIFRGPHDIKQVNLAGVDRVLVFTLRSHPDGQLVVLVRHFAILLKKAADNSKLPRVELAEIGPSFDLVVRRTRFAPDAILKEAMKYPRDPSVDRKRKNISKNELGDRLGRIHVGKQDLSGLALARLKGLGKKRSHIDHEVLDEHERTQHATDNENDISGNSTIDRREAKETTDHDDGQDLVGSTSKRQRVMMTALDQES